ncbi:MAG: cation-translocating P-type ATPase [Rhodospirillaceae bacterium]
MPDTGPAGAEKPLEQLDLTVTGMSCAGCAQSVARALQGVAGVAAADVNFAAGRAHLSFDPGMAPPAVLIEAVTKAGYQASLVDPKMEAAPQPAPAKADFPLVFALGAAVLYLADMVGMMAGGGFLTPVVQAVAATAVQIIAIRRFGRAAYSGAISGIGNMDLLVLLGTTAAYGMSLYNLGAAPAGHHPHLYFEASVVVTAFVLLGRFLEDLARRATRAAVEALMDLRPKTAIVRRDGRDREISVANVALGDVVIVRAGDAIPVDGTVEEGRSAVNAALVTGESLPVEVEPGSAVHGGAVNGDGLIVVRVTATGAETLLGRVIQRVSDAQASAPPVQRLADQVVRVFVPVVLAVTVVTLVVWLSLGAGWETAALNAVSVLVIACPCALGLATPVTIMVGVGRAARAGILFKDAASIETGAKIGRVVLDKTGTLTIGRPQVTAIHTSAEADEAAALALLAAVEQGSSHPLARAVADAAKARGIDVATADTVETVPGRGIKAVVSGRRLAAGNRAFMADLAVAADDGAGGTAVYLAEQAGAGLLARFDFKDAAKPGAQDLADRLKRLGIQASIQSGDAPGAVAEVAEALAIADHAGGLTPDAKADRVAAMKNRGQSVAMVGDGINDAPALAVADLGIAVHGGTDAAMETADVVLLGDDPGLVAETFDVARRVTRKLRQNLFWAFAYNALAIPLAAAGLLSPVVAGGAMALSSLSVVANALLLKR